jgi:hypothetical protein
MNTTLTLNACLESSNSPGEYEIWFVVTGLPDFAYGPDMMNTGKLIVLI